MEIFIDINKACAVTGHRTLLKNFDNKKLKLTLNKIIKSGFDTFLIGMAIGFDTVCFKTLEEIRKKKHIKIVACVPCVSQADKFSDGQKTEYIRMLESADGIFVISQEYTRECMMKRNRYMVDHSSCLLAYVKKDYGGSFATLNYAKKQGKMIIEF